MDTLLTFQWEAFIFLEVLSWIFLLLFLIVRYAFGKESLGRLFLTLFVLFIFLEALLAFIVYQKTGEISTFQVVIFIFVVYACTFGISDFKKLDRYIKMKVGIWRGVELLTEKDKRIIEKLNDPKVIAKKYRLWWYGHTVVFLIAQYLFWIYYGNDAQPFLSYVTDVSWFEDSKIENSPYTNEMILNISRLWVIIYVVDTIYSLYYTFFPSEKK